MSMKVHIDRIDKSQYYQDIFLGHRFNKKQNLKSKTNNIYMIESVESSL